MSSTSKRPSISDSSDFLLSDGTATEQSVSRVQRSGVMAEEPGRDGSALQPGMTLKHYEILRRLGAGGMGTVFLARDIRLGRLVAIKLLQSQGGVSAERFLSEARMTAQCRHENIVVIYDVDTNDGVPYMVLEYVEGRTLRDVIASENGSGVAASVAVELMLPVAKALACAHEMGIVHRDLKPENILLADSGQVKVVDFGIAKQVGIDLARTLSARHAVPVADAQLTKDGVLVGTMPYMSPEQWKEAPVDGRTDIWALGLILFELVKGSHPIEPLTIAELCSVTELDVPMPSARERLPQAKPLADIIDRCLKKRKEERMGSAKALVEALTQLSAEERSVASLRQDQSPFAGLAAFQESEAARFFGRDEDIAAAVARLQKQQLIVIAGASGAGKSSFVRAGLIPALKSAGRNLEAFIARPGRRPLAALADILAFLADTARGADAEEADPESIAGLLREQPGYLGAKLRARCRKRGSEHQILLFVDQFEELYTQGAGAAERAAFCACIEGVADDASSPLRVVMTIRADFLDRVAEDRRFLSAMTRGLVFLPPMTTRGLRDALEKPLEAARYRFEDGRLVGDMLEGLAGSKNPLPLLQFTAAKLWEARDREMRLLTRQAYEALGGVGGALSTHADAVLSGMSQPERRLARSVFLRLVTPEKTRAVVPWEELCSISDDTAAIEQVVQHLGEARLLSIDMGGEREGKTVELVHESLIESWVKLRKWLEENENDAQFLAELRSAAAQWEKNGKADDFLWRDRAAMEAGQWLARRKAEENGGEALGLGKRESGYLEAVVRLSERTRRRRRAWMGAGVVSLLVVVIVVSVLGVRAKGEARRADETAKEAQKSAEEAKRNANAANEKTAEARNASRMASAREHSSDATLALALLRELEPASVLPQRWSELALWATHQDIARVIVAHASRESQLEFAAYSPDGERIVTAAWDKTARIWSADGSREIAVLDGHHDVVRSASFSPDGRLVVTASFDKTARVWNADGTGKPLVLAGHDGPVHSAAWSPDGKTIVTASFDKTARVWNADGSGEPRIFAGHLSEVMDASFSADGKHIVTASKDKTARVWDTDGSGEPRVLKGHDKAVYSAELSPDGRRVVTGSWDGTARVWNADGSGEPKVLAGHQDYVYSARFSPDGEHIVTASWDRTARVWNADGSGAPRVIEGHQDRLNSAMYSPDGRSILTASLDRTARVWDAEGTRKQVRLMGHAGRINTAAFGFDGQYVVTGSEDKTARVWRADGSGEPRVFEGHLGGVMSAGFSHDGKRIATGSADTTARVWNADGTGEPIVLRGHQDVLWSVAFSPDDKRVVTAALDGTARVWNADGKGSDAPIVLRGHTDGLNDAAWSPDGKYIITASQDKTARIWSADGSGEPRVLKGHLAGVYSAVFSPDGRSILTVSWDTTARIWDAETGREQRVLEHGAGAGAGAPGGLGAFTKDGSRLVTLSDDKMLSIWNMNGKGERVSVNIPEWLPLTAALSPDGTRIVTASHDKADLLSAKTMYWASVWSIFEPLKSPEDRDLWGATRYCPPVRLRMELLGVSEGEAEAQLAACRSRVAREAAAR